MQGVGGFLRWYGYYRYLSKLGKNVVPGPVWALTKVIDNRVTYGNWAPAEAQR
jgi:hypothetical protein